MQEIAVTQEEDTQATASAEVAELEEGITNLKEKREVLTKQIARTHSRKDLLEKYSNGLLSAGGQTKTEDLLDPKTIGKVIQAHCCAAILKVEGA